MFYTDKVVEHFMNPRNFGPVEGADGVGQIGDESCGDVLKVYIRIEGDRIAQVGYEVFGCPAAIASCSMMSEMATGMNVDDAWELTDEQVCDALDGLPVAKTHCSNLAATALRNAIAQWALRKPDGKNESTDKGKAGDKG